MTTGTMPLPTRNTAKRSLQHHKDYIRKQMQTTLEDKIICFHAVRKWNKRNDQGIDGHVVFTNGGAGAAIILPTSDAKSVDAMSNGTDWMGIRIYCHNILSMHSTNINIPSPHNKRYVAMVEEINEWIHKYEDNA